MLRSFTNLFRITNIDRISFREDINGLRAIAVLSVLIYHAEVGILKAGFLGVDIFFVISGYLITNIIISELNNQTFKFSNFYLRRIKRILPALFSVLLLSSLFSFFILTPKVLIEYVRSLIPATFFYSNIYFSNLDFYNSEPARFMPLLHTWSLAIEEQFYIIFPLFVFLIHKYFRKYTLQIFLIVIFGSIYLNVSTDSLDKFYLIEFRIWELIIGSVSMIVEQNIKKNKIIAYFGFAIMSFPLFYFNNYWITDIEPKLISLFGVCLILIFNPAKSSLTDILSYRYLEKIGLWSFSIYLFHQPVLVFFRIFNERNLPISWRNSDNQRDISDYFLLILVISLIIYLSKLNYELIEKNFIKSYDKMKSYSLLFSVIIVVIFSVTTFSSNGFEKRWNDNTLTKKALQFQEKNNYDLIIDNQVCHSKSRDEPIKDFCKINNESKNIPIYVLGDSLARTINIPISKMVKDNPITFITGDSCIFLINVFNERCKRPDNELATEYVAEIENSIIIYIADLWQKIEDKPNQLENILVLDLKNTFPTTINYLSKNNKVILLTQIPAYKPSVPTLILEGKDVVKIEYSEWKNLNGVKILDDIYKNLDSENLSIIYVENIFCNSFEKNFCVGNTENKVFYSDPKHLSIEGAELVAEEIFEIVETLNKNQ